MAKFIRARWERSAKELTEKFPDLFPTFADALASYKKESKRSFGIVARYEHERGHILHPNWTPDRGPRRMPNLWSIAEYWNSRDIFNVDLDDPHCFACRTSANIVDALTEEIEESEAENGRLRGERKRILANVDERRLRDKAATCSFPWSTQKLTKEEIRQYAWLVNGHGEPGKRDARVEKLRRDMSTPKGRWNASSRFLERGHLIDRCFDGLDDVQNLVPVCHRCHKLQPSCEPGDEKRAIEYVLNGGKICVYGEIIKSHLGG